MYLAHLEKLGRTRLEDVLVEEGVLDRPRVEDAQAEQEQTGKQLGEVLIERGILTDYDLAKLVATHYSLPYLDVTGYSTRREVLDLLPAEYCERYAILPLDQFGMTITLAVSEMPGTELIDQIVERTKLTPFLFVAQRRALLNVFIDDKKRGPSRANAKPPASSAPAPKVQAPSHAPPPPAQKGGQELPDLDLPPVSMKLVGGPGGAQRSPPPAPARPAQSRETHVGARPAAVGSKGGALSWMDAIGGGPASAPASASPPARSSEPPRPNIQKFPFPGTGAAAKPAPKETLAPVRAASGPGKPGAAPAAAGKPAGAWQSIFDVAEESVKKDKRSP